MTAIVRRFDSLRPRELALLEQALDGDDVLVKGHHTKNVAGHRGGCLPIVGLAISAGMATVLHVELPGFPWRGTALGIALACVFHLVRAFIYARLARKLLAKPEGWLALGWTRERLVYRSFEDNLWVPWSDVETVELMGEDAPKALRGTLWVHLRAGKRVLLASPDEKLAGRTMAEWAKDLRKAKAKS